MPQTVELTDDLRHEWPEGYLVMTFEDDLHEYKVFANQHEAEGFACQCAEASGTDWPIYPLWAGHAATDEQLRRWK